MIHLLISFAVGVVTELYVPRTGLPQPLQPFLMIGLLGGFIAFDGLPAKAALLYERGKRYAAFAHLVLLVMVRVAAVSAGGLFAN